MTDYNRIAHLVTHRFLEPVYGEPASRRERSQPRAPATIDTMARWDPSPFATSIARHYTVNRISRCVPLSVFRTFQALAAVNGIPFPVDTAFLRPTGDNLSIPAVDVALLSAFVQLPGIGIDGTLRIFRGQTSRDQRPNKALRPELYRLHLASYPDLDRLCSIAADGVIPHWTSSSLRVGVRPLPPKYPSAIEGARVVTNRLLNDYYKGRCILATVAALSLDPSFHSSAFALVPKQDKPISDDGRTIHDLSAPAGLSVNDITDASFTPDARWDPYISISSRVLELRRRYPGYVIYALGADIAEAFLHIPVHSRHASAFGGTIPRSQVGIVSGIAVFGWTASSGYFAIAGKAARHYQRTGASYVLGFPEPFWIFQWIDDIVIIEVDIGDRFLRAERRLRDAINLVFGSEGWHEGKFRTWSQCFHAVGIDWNISESNITIPQRKIAKTKRVVAETMTMSFITSTGSWVSCGTLWRSSL